MGNSVKIKDVAEAAGVSTATVSYVMNGKAEGLGITLATRQRVLDAVRRTGYRPNRVAREMALGQESAAALPATPATDLETILAAAGYSLVPVASVNDLPRLPGGGLVGVVYKAALQELPQTPHPGPLPQGERVQNTSQGESDLLPLPLRERVGVRGIVVSPLVLPQVDADACGEPSRTVPAASVPRESTPGTDGARMSAGSSAGVPEAEVPKAGRSPSTPAPEPEATATPLSPVAATGAAEVLIQLPNNAADTAATTEETPPAETPVVTAVPGCTEIGEPPPVLPPVDADLPASGSPADERAASVTSENTLGPDGARRSPSTLAPEPVADATPPSTTEQPDNPTTFAAPTADATPQPPIAAAGASEIIIQPPNNAADTLLRPGERDFEGQAAATTEEVPVAAESPVVTAACPEPVEGVPGGTVTGETPSGTTVAEPSPSTLAPEPVAAATPEPAPTPVVAAPAPIPAPPPPEPEPIPAPAPPASVVEPVSEPVVDVTPPSTTQPFDDAQGRQPDNLTTASDQEQPVANQ